MSVYTSLNLSQLKQLLNLYELGEITHYEGISDGIENTNYRVSTTYGHYILTIFEHYTAKELPYFLQLTAFLHEHGMSVPQAITNSHQQYLTSWQSKPVALFNCLSGQSILKPDINHCQQMGKALAQLHILGQKFPLHQPNQWDNHWIQETGKMFISDPQSSQLNQDDRQLLFDELKFQKSRHQPLPQGVIHADLFCDNVLFDNDQLSGLLDFYTACNAPLLFDLAITINAWCLDDDTNHYLDTNKARAMIEAYEQLRPLNSAEKQYWPTMLRSAALRFWLSRLINRQSCKEAELTLDKDPDVLKCLLLKHRDNLSFCQSLLS